MIRAVLFLLGLALMAAALVVEIVPRETAPWRSWLFDAGLLLAVGASHWPL
jgi:hypothetical protein